MLPRGPNIETTVRPCLVCCGNVKIWPLKKHKSNVVSMVGQRLKRWSTSSNRRKYVYIPIPEILCMFLYLYARLTFVLELL